jgi:ADP-ribose pyrophosphatase
MSHPHPKARPIPPHPLFAPESEETVWAGRFAYQILRFRFRRFDGTLSGLLTWELWRRGRAVAILPYDPWTDRVGLIEQFRLPALAAGLDPLLLECPAGLLEPDEDPDEAARRETAEETGLAPDRFARIGEFLLMQGGCDETVTFTAARCRLPEPGTHGDHGLASEQESTRLVVLTAADAFDAVATNGIRNAPTALALLWLQTRHAALRADWSTA